MEQSGQRRIAPRASGARQEGHSHRAGIGRIDSSAFSQSVRSRKTP